MNACIISWIKIWKEYPINYLGKCDYYGGVFDFRRNDLNFDLHTYFKVATTHPKQK